MIIQLAKEKCSQCGKPRVYFKSVPMACDCFWKKLRKDAEAKKKELQKD